MCGDPSIVDIFPKEIKYFAGVLLDVIETKNLDKDEIVATLKSWSKLETGK